MTRAAAGCSLEYERWAVLNGRLHARIAELAAYNVDLEVHPEPSASGT